MFRLGLGWGKCFGLRAEVSVGVVSEGSSGHNTHCTGTGESRPVCLARLLTSLWYRVLVICPDGSLAFRDMILTVLVLESLGPCV